MEILFYHLQNTRLEQTLPLLLEKSLSRGWKSVVRASSPERLKALDDHLWTYSDDSFLPHGLAAGNETADLPIILTEDDERFGNADVMFAVDGADLPVTVGWQRAVLMFDGNDQTALDNARASWKSVKAKGFEATYWQQDDTGRWVKKA
ncbi:MAG: DNA polymerase III subunit chi [Beijerinckiaceae bacterium]